MNIATITDAKIYSIKNGLEIAYEQTITGGKIQGEFKVRAVESKNSYIRTESLINGAWKESKVFIVKTNKLRSAEKIKFTVNSFLRS